MEIGTPKEYTFPLELITIYFKQNRGNSKNMYDKLAYGPCLNIME